MNENTLKFIARWPRTDRPSQIHLLILRRPENGSELASIHIQLGTSSVATKYQTRTPQYPTWVALVMWVYHPNLRFGADLKENATLMGCRRELSSELPTEALRWIRRYSRLQ